MLHQFICSQEQIDLTVDGLFRNFKNLIISGHFLLCCDWPLVPKLTVIGAFNRKLINYLGNHKIFKYFIKWIGSCWQMNWMIQHSRNTSIATAVNRKITTTSLNLYLITLLLSLGIKHNKQALQKGSLGSYSLPIWGAKCYKQMKFKQKLANIFLMT